MGKLAKLKKKNKVRSYVAGLFDPQEPVRHRAMNGLNVRAGITKGSLMETQMQSPALSQPALNKAHSAEPFCRGVHHLVFNTDDMKKTVDFFVDVLGMPLVHAMRVPPGLGTGPGNRGNPPYEEVRHYFFDMGNDSLIAFFEMPKGAEPAGHRNAIGAMQHCSFVVPPDRFREIEQRLKANGLQCIGPLPQMPGLLGLYFFDPNGIRLEFCCQPDDGDLQQVLGLATQARAELQRELASLPGATQQWVEQRTAHIKG